MLAVPMAATVDVEKLIWTPSIQVVTAPLPIPGTIGAITRAEFAFWINMPLYETLLMDWGQLQK